jgi:hypothetical protein
VITALQANALAKVDSSGIEGSEHGGATETPTIRIKKMVGDGGEFDFSRLAEVGDVEPNWKVTRSALRRPVCVEGDVQGFEVVGAVFGKGGDGEKETQHRSD